MDLCEFEVSLACRALFRTTRATHRNPELKSQKRGPVGRGESKRGGKDPNEWSERPEIDEFIKEQYKEVFAPDVLNRIRNENAEDLKNRILKLAKVDPDIGLRFLE